MSALAHDPQPLEVLIADDHDLFALGLEETLAHYPDMTVVGRATDGAEAVALASALRPDVVLMDVSMPRVDGILATREITDTFERARVVMLSALKDLETICRARAAGAAAYLSKGCPVDEVISVVREVADRSSDGLELLERLPAAAAVAH
jgi:two-component system, NarL family, response regulator LiaR